MTFTINIAKKNISINALFSSTERFCHKYISHETADFEVSVDERDIDAEIAISGNEVIAGANYYEKIAVCRKISERMPAYDTMLFHGSVVAVDGEAYLFTAKSGTGKSTHTRLWRENFGERAVMVNDDKPLLIIKDGEALACGTPWCGKHGLNTNVIVPLKAVCILERSETNRIEEISQREAWPMLMQQCYHPKDFDMMEKSFELVDRLGSSVKLYRLGCNMDIEAARIAYEKMKG